ncbi:MAG TPA: aminodeoxychorismate synthase component I [Prolixibacteraceae bacterium]|nr:aminodeoxychorismate synthase component I [Prolixibacteraceae bacterium]
MNEIQKDTIERMNELGAQGKPFVFMIDFDFEKPLIFDLDDTSDLLWKTPESANYLSADFQEKKEIIWDVQPVGWEHYQQAFNEVQRHIHNGDTYLVNLTMPAKVETNLSAEEIFHQSSAPYKVWLKDQFVCFSPEIFVRINDGIISSFPMKGTIDAHIENAEQLLKNDEKEVAEHHTIVDLIRNDLSIVASEVEVERFMYIDRIKTNRCDLLQMSSQISGRLPENYQSSIGTLLAKLLPAGSICGAPKAKTVEIIRKIESYHRGYYSGVFGVFDGKNLDSCVLIRYLEQDGHQLTFKSGGGITFLSDCQSEYNEIIQKIYVPIN